MHKALTPQEFSQDVNSGQAVIDEVGSEFIFPERQSEDEGQQESFLAFVCFLQCQTDQFVLSGGKPLEVIRVKMREYP